MTEVIEEKAEKPEIPLLEDDDQVLDLTSISRRVVKLPTAQNPKGELFELRLLDDFPIARQQQLLNYQRKFQELWSNEGDDLTDDQQSKLKFYLDEIFNAVLNAPSETRKQMPDSVRNRVVTAFSLAPLLARQDVERRRGQDVQRELLKTLVDKGMLSQRQVDQVRDEMGIPEQTSGS